MQFILEDTWTINGEADDIINFANTNNIKCNIINEDELYNLDSNYFFNNIFFCNTDIVQHHLNKIGKINIFPNTYDMKFNELYKRNI